MTIRMPPQILRSIQIALDDAYCDRNPIRVYAEAERIRRENSAPDVPLEMIVAQFLAEGRMQGIAFEIEARREAGARREITRASAAARD